MWEIPRTSDIFVLPRACPCQQVGSTRNSTARNRELNSPAQFSDSPAEIWRAVWFVFLPRRHTCVHPSLCDVSAPSKLGLHNLEPLARFGKVPPSGDAKKGGSITLPETLVRYLSMNSRQLAFATTAFIKSALYYTSLRTA